MMTTLILVSILVFGLIVAIVLATKISAKQRQRDKEGGNDTSIKKWSLPDFGLAGWTKSIIGIPVCVGVIGVLLCLFWPERYGFGGIKLLPDLAPKVKTWTQVIIFGSCLLSMIIIGLGPKIKDVNKSWRPWVALMLIIIMVITGIAFLFQSDIPPKVTRGVSNFFKAPEPINKREKIITLLAPPAPEWSEWYELPLDRPYTIKPEKLINICNVDGLIWEDGPGKKISLNGLSFTKEANTFRFQSKDKNQVPIKIIIR